MNRKIHRILIVLCAGLVIAAAVSFSGLLDRRSAGEDKNGSSPDSMESAASEEGGNGLQEFTESEAAEYMESARTEAEESISVEEKERLMAEDASRIAAEEYDAVFLSMFPIENYAEESLESSKKIRLLKASYCIPDAETLSGYLQQIEDAGQEVQTVFLGVRPDLISADDFLELTDAFSRMRYEVLVAYPSLEYWKNLDGNERTAKLYAYAQFISTLMPIYEDNEWFQENLSIYFYGASEWLVGNPANYEDAFLVNEGISESLAAYADEEHGYLLTLDNYGEVLETFESLVNTACDGSAAEYTDLSGWDVVFFGDSIIAFAGTASVPWAFSGLTGANVYNCGLGGCSAAKMGGNSLGVSGMVDAFLTEDLSQIEEGTQLYAGLSEYFEKGKEDRRKCFVMNFGLNDFFDGVSVGGDDLLDESTYTGALRSAAGRLKEAYPDSVILLAAPGFTTVFENGTQAQSDAGGVLTDYVDAVVSLCEEEGFLLYDNYHTLGIDATNQASYLMDGCHPYEAARYKMAQGMAEIIGGYVDGTEQKTTE